MNLIITPEDFELLRNNDTSWADILRYSADITTRFRVVAKRKTLGNPLTRIYWFGRDYVTVILARTFLENYGHEYEVLWDNAGEWEKPSFGYAILTDYERKD